jgi:predicted Zn-dependent protease
LLRDAIEWLRARPEEEARASRSDLAQALYVAERWEEARVVYEELAAEFPRSIRFRGMVGAIAARTGDTIAAEEISAAIGEMTPRRDRPSQHLYTRARIAALLGKPDEAMRLLQNTLSGGMPYVIDLHLEMDFESLRERADYQELMRSKE